MASGSISLSSSKAWRGKIAWSAEANTAGNYSRLYVCATMWKTDGYMTSSNSRTSGSITIDGTSYDLIGYQEFEDEVCIFEDTITIYHDDDGKKSVSISLSCNGQSGTSLSGYTLDGSGVAVLDTIYRSATLSVGDGTLGTEQTISVVSDSTSLKYTISYSCGSNSGTIVSKTTSKSIKWTPPLELATANTTGTSVSVKLTLTTYAGSTSIGTATATFNCAIPASVKPSFTVAFSDAAGYKDTYGVYLQMLSCLRIVVDATAPHGATVKTYKITANGETLTNADSTTSVLTKSGEITVRVSVTDSRNRTTQADYTVDVEAYSRPNVSQLAVLRCNSDGTANDQGGYVKVTYSATADALDSQNTVSYKLEYKKTSVSSYTVVNLTQYNNNFSISGQYIFAADTGSSYNVRLTATDKFIAVTKETTASTAATIMHYKADGRGIGLGKISEVVDAVDVGWDVHMNGNAVTGLGTPTDDTDAVPLGYLNDELADYLGVVLKTGQYGTAANRPAAGTRGRIYFQKVGS